ncbi:serine/threonine protein kinase [Streptomyces sp. NBC_01795]|uniref:serine/threonine-protein kinase n=1 Tax=Streptomyces sp. NBC_01795 TaxID=2975943 RepID=UPI002DDC369D|nr:serine/threonine-protein kinase [Streptomyces sp. NBC_01795]WSA91538.1 serine/threonine protein kinase [Streptomyces sp. NBC_01795]
MRSLRAEDPERIGEYRLLGRLGEGGMGCVYLAQSPRGRTVAVKLVRRELAEHVEFRRRFEQEISAARRVGGEWTAPVLDADPDAAQPWVATGYIAGISLHEAVAGRRATLPERTLRILANRLGLALRAIHEAGLIHRDVKPSNILVTIDGPRVIDFGIARALETVADGNLTRTGDVIGSPGFMSPEQVRGDHLSAASDIFSLGSVLAFAATGRTPFGSAGSAGHALMYRITHVEPDLEGVPEGLRSLVADCLAKGADERPTVAALVERTADPEDAPGPSATAADSVEPWLPASLVAHLGRHAARLLDAEVPGAQAAADRAAEAPAIPPQPDAPPGAHTPGSPAPEAPGPAAQAPAGDGEAGQPKAEPDAGGEDGAAADDPDAQGGGSAEDPGLHGLATVTGSAQPAPTPTYVPTPTNAPAAAPVPAVPPGWPEQTPYPAYTQAQTERSHRRGALLGALGVVLALVSGAGTFVALRVYDSSGEDSGNRSSPQAHKTPDAGGPVPSKPSGADRTSPPPGGALPQGYVGAWQGSVQDADGSTITRRFEIRQGEKGEVVAKTFNLRDDAMCEGEATLVSFGSGMRITSEITESHPASKPCTPYGEQTLTLKPDGTLGWTYPASSLSATLRRVTDTARPVPRRLLGKWEAESGEGGGLTLDFGQGRVGTATLKMTGKDDPGCEATMQLGAADGEALVYGPAGSGGEAAGPCEPAGKTLAVTLLAGDKLRLNSPQDTSDTALTFVRP